MDQLFEANYFEGHYKSNTGMFTLRDLEKSVNWYWGWIKNLQKKIDLKNGKEKTFLEVGCGIAPLARILQERGFRSSASDISHFAINKAKKLQSEVVFFQQDIMKPPKRKEKFNLIMAFEVIEHLQYPERGIKNMFMLLKNNGILVCSTPFPCKKAYNDPTHIQVHDKNYWENMYKQIGFHKVTAYYLSFVPFLYRLNKYFSIAIPIKIGMPYINSTIIIIAEK